MAEAFRSGNLGVMDYYRMKNIQATPACEKALRVRAAARVAPVRKRNRPATDQIASLRERLMNQ